MLWIVCIISWGIIVILGADYYPVVRTWLSRIKIGRWNDPEHWKSCVEKKAEEWLFHTPAVKKTDSARLLLLDMLRGDYGSATIQSWQTAALFLGIRDKEIKKRFATQILESDTGLWRTAPQEVDYAIMAYGILLNAEDCSCVRPAMDQMLSCIMERKNEDGLIAYRVQNKRILYVDTMGFICPFLILYGIKYSDVSCVRLALKQIDQFSRDAVLEFRMLPAHAYDLDRKVPLGLYGWGRGLGWYMLGLIDSYLELRKYCVDGELTDGTAAEEVSALRAVCAQGKEYLEALLLKTAEAVLPLQQTDGGFGSSLLLDGGYDSSITAVAGYFYRQCGHIFANNTYSIAADKCVRKLMSVTRRDGAIDMSQGDTKGIGLYSVNYDILPFTQGIALRIGDA